MEQRQTHEMEQRITLQMRLTARLIYLFVVVSIEAVELALAASVSWWTWNLLFLESPTAKIYYTSPFHIGPGYAWTILWAATSLLSWLSIFHNWQKMRRWLMLWQVFAWIYTSVVLFSADESTVWSGQSIIFACMAVWVYLRLRFTEENSITVAKMTAAAKRVLEEEAEHGT